MDVMGVGHCRSCGAVVNVHWATCVVCNRPLPPYPSLEPGCRIWWVGNRVHVPLEGPAVVLGTFIDSSTGEPWCWFSYRGSDYLKLCRSISRWEPPKSEHE